jgi:subtilisin family serine protease
MRKHYLLFSIFSLSILASCKKDISSNEALSPDIIAGQANGTSVAESVNKDNIAPNEILVKFKKGTSEKGRANALARMGGNVKEHIVTKAMERLGDEGVFLIHTNSHALEAIVKARGLEVEFAEPNYIYTHGAVSTDAYFMNGTLWGMYGAATSPANQFGSHAAQAWAAGKTGNSNVFIGIIDEGFQYTHPDLDANAWNNPYDAPADGLDNDGNGYRDDSNGWDFANNDKTVYDGGKRGSLDNHGTHVAGTIGAENNGTGVVGVNWKVTMISGKFLGRNGGTTANAVKAIDYFTDLKKRHGLNIVATNNSWSGGGYSQALRDAIERANTAGILFIAAAGNGGNDGIGDNNDAAPTYPANYNNSNIISVAAITSTGAKSGFSNYGATSVDIGAPGSGINSCLAYDKYGAYSGTSMATPHVTGGAALFASTHPGATAAAIKAAIINNAIPTASLSGKCVSNGRLNVSNF